MEEFKERHGWCDLWENIYKELKKGLRQEPTYEKLKHAINSGDFCRGEV